MLLLVNLFIVCFGALHAWTPPDYVTICKRFDPNLADCWRKNFEKVVPMMDKELPEMGLISLKPAKWGGVDLNLGNDQSSVSFHAHLDDLWVYGLTGTKLEKVEIAMDDPNNLVLNAVLYVDAIDTESTYKAKGKFLLLEFNSQGNVKGNITKLRAPTEWSGKIYKKDGVDHFKYTLKSIDMEVGSIYAYFDNLFEGNEEVTKGVNDAVNQNFDVIFKELKPAFLKALTRIVEQMINSFCEKVPADDLFPPK